MRTAEEYKDLTIKEFTKAADIYESYVLPELIARKVVC